MQGRGRGLRLCWIAHLQGLAKEIVVESDGLEIKDEQWRWWTCGKPAVSSDTSPESSRWPSIPSLDFLEVLQGPSGVFQPRCAPLPYPTPQTPHENNNHLRALVVFTLFKIYKDINRLHVLSTTAFTTTRVPEHGILIRLLKNRYIYH